MFLVKADVSSVVFNVQNIHILNSTDQSGVLDNTLFSPLCKVFKSIFVQTVVIILSAQAGAT